MSVVTFPPIRQSPDDLMEVPIADLIARLDRRIRRLVDWQNMAAEMKDHTSRDRINAVMKREFDLVQVAATALRARAAEVEKFAAALRLRCHPEDVRANPFIIACALMKITQGEKYGRNKS